jgi:HEAT repeat protein
MRQLCIALVVLALVAVTARAHGGSYRGPHGEIPPNMRPPEDPPPPHGDGTPTPPPDEDPSGTPTGGDGPGNGRPAPPPQEPPGGGDVGRVPPRVPDGAGPGSGATTGPGRKGNGPPPPTLDNWEFWWGLNKDAILDLKGALGARNRTAVTGVAILGAGRRLGKSPDGAQAPTLLAIEETIVPALERVVDDPDLHFDLRAGAVIALAKVASTLPAVQASTARRLIDVMNNADGKQHFSVEESGALALGLLRCKDEVVLDALCDRALDGKRRGNPRTRAFALLALGLLEVEPTDDGYERVAQTLATVVRKETTFKDLPVCALVAMGLSGDSRFLPDLVTMVKTERAYGVRRLDDLLRSYAVSAIGRILESHPDRADKATVSLLEKVMINRGTHTKRSAVLACGQIDLASVEPALVRGLVRALEHVVRKGERQAAHFALVSLGKIGGKVEDARLHRRIFESLHQAMQKGSHTGKPFAALALGLMGRSPNLEASRSVFRELLRHEFVTFRGDPRNRAAYAIALGMLRDRGAVEPLIEVLVDRGEVARLRGACAVALGMIRDPRALEPVREVLAERRDRELRVDTAIAAGLLGDTTVIPVLVDILRDASSSLYVQGSVALALGRIGDRRAIDPLVTMMEGERVKDLNRALAAVALGLLGDRNPVPVLSRLSRDVNYRAAVNAMNEVLTIL